MKTLQTIQKTCQVFQVLTKVAEILCIVGASLCAAFGLCALGWSSGGTVFSLFGKPVENFLKGDLRQTCAGMLAAGLALTAHAILFGFAQGYLQAEQAEGMPFTQTGAARLNRLGIRCLYLPAIAAALAGAVAAWQGVEGIADGVRFGSPATGVVLILAALVLRYGAELERGTK